jgi:hypothetical protein
MADSPFLLARLLNSPDLAAVVPRLQPVVLRRLIETCGLEDCAEFVALATPEQLARVLDLDVWRARTRGADEEFDADRFGTWLAVLMQAGAEIAAEKLAGLDIDLVIAGLARQAAVFDHTAVSSYTTLDGEHVPGRAMDHGAVSEIGGYVIEARRTSSTWDAFVDLLAFLHADRSDYFHRLMRGCVRLSNGTREEDGCDSLLEADEQEMFDLASDREARRERQGYVTPAQAHAFLRAGRDLQFDGERPARSAIARAYFRAIEPISTPHTETADESDRGSAESPPDASPQADPAGVIEVLRDAGVLEGGPRALLGAAVRQTARLSFIQEHVAIHPGSGEELAYLTNTMVAGCPVQGRPLTPREAGDAVAATCNLGLENWPELWSDPDLVTAFQVGWTILHRQVCTYVAERLIDVLGEIRCSDRDIQLRLDGLRRELSHGLRNREPWRARTALDAILMLDQSAWAALLALIDECPVIHAALAASRQSCRRIDPTDFEFISQNSQIAAVRQFMASLPSVLAG